MSNLPPNPEIHPVTPGRTFRYFCQKVLPAVYDESLSYYELLCKLTAKINEIISGDDTQNAAISELQNLYVQLKTYVDNYFKNLNVQTQINNKLDEMAQSSELAEIIALYLGTINLFGFLTLTDLKAAENLTAGLMVRTMGTINYTDGDGFYYYIRTKTIDDIIDDDNIVGITADNTIVAEKIPDPKLDDIISDLATLSDNLSALSDLHAAEVGDITNLTTTDKSNLVAAINENTSNITSNRTDTIESINNINSNIGALSDLATTSKNNIVAAVNEVKTEKIPLTRGGTNATSAYEARQNLGVMTGIILFDSLEQPNQEPTNGNIDFEVKLMDLGLDLKDFKYLEFYYSNLNEGVSDDGMCCARVYRWGDDSSMYFDNSINLNMHSSTSTDKLYFNIAHTRYDIGTSSHPSEAIRKSDDGKTATLQFTLNNSTYDYSITTGADIYVYRVVGYI